MAFLTSNLLSWSTRFLVGSIVFFALFTLLVRLALPFADSYKSHLSAWLGSYLNTPVDIQQIQADVQGFALVFDLQGVTLGQPGEPLELQQASLVLGFDGWRLNIDRLQLKLFRHTSGEFALQGLPVLQASDGPLDLPPLTLVLRDAQIVWHDQRYSAAPLALPQVQLALRVSDGKAQLNAQFDNQLGKLTFSADMQADFSQGNSYLSWQNLPLAKVSAPYLPTDYRLENGQLNTQIWQRWDAGIPAETQAWFALDSAGITAMAGTHDVQAKLDFALQANGAWALRLADVLLDGNSDAIGRIAVRNSPADKLDAALESLAIQPILDLAQNHPALSEFKSTLAGLNPTGRLHDARLQLDLAQTAPSPHWTLNSAFEKLSVANWQHIPGIQHMQGEWLMQPDKASVQLQLQDSQLAADRLFNQALPIKQLATTLYAVADTPDQWRIQTDNIRLDTPDFSAKGLMQLTLAKGKTPHLDTQFYVAQIDASQVKHYVPPKLVEPGLTEWLDMALLEGRLEHTRLLLSGPVDTFPYHITRNGVFEVASKVRDLKLRYQTGWPVLNVDDGLVRFYQNSMQADMFTGGLYNSQVTGKVRIQNLDPTSSLIAQGKASGPLQDILQLLKTDALRENFGQIAEAIQIQGDGDTALNLAVPLVTGRGEFKIQGQMDFADNQLHLKDMDLTAKQIHGQLALQQTLLHAKNIRANVLGRPVRIDIQPKSGNNQIKLASRISPDLLKQLAPEMAFDHLQGETPAVVTLDLPGLSRTNSSGEMALRVQSDLHGLQIDLPEPLGKPANTKRPVTLAVSLGDQSAPVYLDYADAWKAVFSPDGQRAEVRYKAGKPRLPQQGYRLEGNFDTLDLGDWQVFIQTLPTQEGPNKSWQVQLTSGVLDYKGLHLNNASVRLEKNAGKLRGLLDSGQIKGNFVYAQNTAEPLSIHLDKAHIAWKKSSGRKPLPEDFGPDPRTLPAVRLICEDLQVNKMPLGQLILDSRKVDQGLHIHKLLVASQYLSLNSRGHWLMQETRPSTRLQGKFHADNLGNFLDAMGFLRNVDKADTNLLFDLNWPGHPLQVRKETIAGTANLSMVNGRLSELEPGLLKVLGLLNLEVLGRRLRLDFDDLLHSGYSFDAIKGDFDLAEGNANTRNLQISGSASYIQMGGRIGYIERDFDAQVYVTPELDGTVLLAGVLAGGPVAGLGALLVQKILEDEVNDFSRFEYGVTGSWDDPKLDPLDTEITSDAEGSPNQANPAGLPKIPKQQMIAPDTDKQGFLNRLLEKIQSGEADQEWIDGPQFEVVD